MLPIRREPLSEDDRTTLGRILAVDQALTLPWPSARSMVVRSLVFASGTAMVVFGITALVGSVGSGPAGSLGVAMIIVGVLLTLLTLIWPSKPRTLAMTPAPSMSQAARAMLDSGEAIIAEVACDAAWTMPDEYPDPGLPRVLVRLGPDRFVVLPEAPAIDGPDEGPDEGPDDGPYHIPARSDLYLSALPEHEPWILHSHAQSGAERVPLREDLLKLSEAEAENELEEFRAYSLDELPELWRPIVRA
jgi:hypothetical protein